MRNSRVGRLPEFYPMKDACWSFPSERLAPFTMPRRARTQACEWKRTRMTRVQRPTVYTVGHSTRSIAEFVDLLKQGRVELVVDIRSTPRSHTNPQFNLDDLPEALTAWQIGYTRIAELGGRRTKSKTIPPEVNGFWMNQSFHNYADFALSDEFRAGFSSLIELCNERRCAIMCSEAVWWRCHRRFMTGGTFFI